MNEANIDRIEEGIYRQKQITVGDFNTLLLIMGSSVRQINKETEDLKNTIDKLVLIDIHNAFHLTRAEHSSQEHIEYVHDRSHIWPQKQNNYHLLSATQLQQKNLQSTTIENIQEKGILENKFQYSQLGSLHSSFKIKRYVACSLLFSTYILGDEG